MTSRNLGLSIILSTAIISGCASTGDKDASFMDKVGKTTSDAGAMVGSSVSSMFSGYENGHLVTQEYLDSLSKGVTTISEVKAKLGEPDNLTVTTDGNVLEYGYTKIANFSKDVTETTVFEFSHGGLLTKAFKKAGRSTSTGNELLDASNG